MSLACRKTRAHTQTHTHIRACFIYECIKYLEEFQSLQSWFLSTKNNFSLKEYNLHKSWVYCQLIWWCEELLLKAGGAYLIIFLSLNNTQKKSTRTDMQDKNKTKIPSHNLDIFIFSLDLTVLMFLLLFFSTELETKTMKSLPACVTYTASEWWTVHLSSSRFAWLLVAVAVMYGPSAATEGILVYKETFGFSNKLAVRVNSSFKPHSRNVEPSNSLWIPILSLCQREPEYRSWGEKFS